jgi:hypothetical protein
MKIYTFTSLVCLVASVADLLLLYSPVGGYETGDYAFLQGILYERMLVGHYLGIFAIPLVLPGLWRFTRSFSPAGARIPDIAFFASAFVLAVGVAYHGGVIGLKQGVPLEAFRQSMEPLGFVMAVVFFVLSIGFGWYVKTGKTTLPLAVFWLNPFFIYLVFVVLYYAVPVLGNVLLPAGFNCSLAILFGRLALLPAENKGS